MRTLGIFMHIQKNAFILRDLHVENCSSSPYSLDQAILLFGRGYLLKITLMKRLVHLTSMHMFGKELYRSQLMKTPGIFMHIQKNAFIFRALHMANHSNSPYSFDPAILLFGNCYLLENTLLKRLAHLTSMHTFGKALNLI